MRLAGREFIVLQDYFHLAFSVFPTVSSLNGRKLQICLKSSMFLYFNRVRLFLRNLYKTLKFIDFGFT